MGRGSNLPRVGGFNRAVVLEAIRHSAEGLTRAQLGRLTRLAPQTVSNVTRDLLQESLVREAGLSTPAGRGRPGVYLQLNPTSRYAIGVHLDPASLGLVILDLSGTIVAESYGPLPAPERPMEVVSSLHSRIEALQESASIPRKRVLGVGIAAPGPLDEAAGVVSPPLLPGWDRVPLREALRERIGATVILDKDVTAAAKAHLWLRDTSDAQSFLFFYVGAGVAMATTIDGEVVRGRTGNAGEAGHLTGDPEGPRCLCGKRGCLGATLGEAEMVERAREEKLPVPQVPRDRDPLVIDAAFTTLLKLAHDGDPRARTLFAEAGHSLATAVASVCELLDLDTVIVGGPRWEAVRELIEPATVLPLSDHRVHGQHRPIRLLTSRLGWRAGAVGAACLVLDEVFTPRSSSLLIDS